MDVEITMPLQNNQRPHTSTRVYIDIELDSTPARLDANAGFLEALETHVDLVASNRNPSLHGVLVEATPVPLQPNDSQQYSQPTPNNYTPPQ